MPAFVARFLILLPTLLGSADPSPEPVAAKPPKADIRGTITNISLSPVRNKGPIAAMLVEGGKEADTQHDKARVRLMKTTRFYRWVDGKKKEIKLEDLKKGARVQAVFTGPVAESYPVQAVASEVLLLADPR